MDLERITRLKFWLHVLDKYTKMMDAITVGSFLGMFVERGNNSATYLAITAVSFFVASAIFEIVRCVMGEEYE